MLILGRRESEKIIVTIDAKQFIIDVVEVRAARSGSASSPNTPTSSSTAAKSTNANRGKSNERGTAETPDAAPS